MPNKPEFHRNDVRMVAGVITDRLEGNMKLACVYVEGKVIKKLQRGQPTISINPKKGGEPYRVGLDPSQPGEPPKKVTGLLADSVTYKVVRSTSQIIGYVGVNTIYARRLEQGFVGTDAGGRSVNQLPRPYLRVTVIEERGPVVTILQKGRL